MVTRGVSYYWQVVLGVAVALALIPSTKPDECSTYTRCSDCITLNTSCAWCDDIIAFRAYADQSTDTDPAPMCGTVDQLISTLNCSPARIMNPNSSQIESNTAADAQVSPAAVQVNLRPGFPTSFNITVRPATSISVDMYILMDLSATMLQRLVSLRSFARELISRMQSLTDEFQIGFGSFIDKRVPPFAERFTPEFPCAADSSLGQTPATCEPIYGFRHRLNLTANASEFQDVLDRALISASADTPEAILDGILQVAVCENEVGWRPSGESRRLIVAVTDGDYHYALDGKLGGIVNPPDRDCHLVFDPLTRDYMYNYDTRQDYPSSAFIADILNERRIIPIFAIPRLMQPTYLSLRDTIRSAFVGTLASDPDDLLSEIERQYRILSATVVPVITGIENLPINITVLPVNECAPWGTLRNNSLDVCENVNPPNNVTYTVTVEVSSDICNVMPVSDRRALVQFIGFGQVELNMTFRCDCDCDRPTELNSLECNGTGTLECSSCQCREGDGAPRCNCPLSVGAVQGCRTGLFGQEECSGVGTCVCGQCICNRVSDDSDLRYQGEQCQHDPTVCPVARNENSMLLPCADSNLDWNQNGMLLPCAGNGDCINSVCVCNERFTGAACDCPRDTSNCRGCLDDETSVCSGEGDCVCGVCVCRDYGSRFGRFCEECGPCRSSCSVINRCIRCNFTNGIPCDEEDQCEKLRFVSSPSQVPGFASIPDCDNPLFKTCSMNENGCEVRYSVSRLLTGNEQAVHVVIDMNQTSIATLRTDRNQCSSQVLIWPIIVGIILGIILVGVIVVIVWRCLVYLWEYLEYKQWEKSVMEETSRRGNNPLFVDPNTKYQNPRYRPMSDAAN